MSSICDAFKDILGNTRDIPNPNLDELRWDKTKITDKTTNALFDRINKGNLEVTIVLTTYATRRENDM